MKSFTLHEDTGEGDSAKKTDELHSFLQPICNQDSKHDFEGSNSGLMIYLHVEVGDTMILRDDGSIRVIEKDEPIRVNKHSFPMVHMAMLTIEQDSGAHHVNRIVALSPGFANPVNLVEFEVPYSYGVDRVCTAEDAMFALMSTGFENIETFIIGEQSEQEALIQSLEPAIPGLRTAHALLNDWFNAWELS
jgi:hypothetical protein